MQTETTTLSGLFLEKHELILSITEEMQQLQQLVQLSKMQRRQKCQEHLENERRVLDHPINRPELLNLPNPLLPNHELHSLLQNKGGDSVDLDNYSAKNRFSDQEFDEIQEKSMETRKQSLSLAIQQPEETSLVHSDGNPKGYLNTFRFIDQADDYETRQYRTFSPRYATPKAKEMTKKNPHQLRNPKCSASSIIMKQTAKSKTNQIWRAATHKIQLIGNLNYSATLKQMDRIETINSQFSISSFLTGIPLFHSLTKSQFQLIENQSQCITYKKGDEITTFGKEALFMHVIQLGTILLKNKMMINSQSKTIGSYFGVTDMVKLRCSSIQAIALTDAQCIAIPSKVVEKLELTTHILKVEDEMHMENKNKTKDSLATWMALYCKIVGTTTRKQKNSMNDQPSRCRSNSKSLLRNVLMTMSLERSIDDVFERLVHTFKVFFSAERVRLTLVDYKKQEFFIKFSKDSSMGLSHPFYCGIAGDILKKKGSLNISSLSPEKDYFLQATGIHTRALMASPFFIHSDVVYGVFEVMNPLKGKCYTNDDLQLLDQSMHLVGDYLFKNEHFFHLTQQDAYIPIYQVPNIFSFSVKDIQITNHHRHLRLETCLYHGNRLLTSSITTHLEKTIVQQDSQGNYKCSASFSTHSFIFSFNLQNLPQAAILVFKVSSKGTNDVAYGICHLFDSYHQLISGKQKVFLRKGKCPFYVPSLASSLANAHDTFLNEGLQDDFIHLEMPTFHKPVLYQTKILTKPSAFTTNTIPSNPIPTTTTNSITTPITNPIHSFGLATKTSTDFTIKKHHGSFTGFQDVNLPLALRQKIDFICQDLSTTITDLEKLQIWSLRTDLLHFPKLLPVFLLCMDWGNREQVHEGYHYLYEWNTPTYIEALQLLDKRFPDPTVRSYAVDCLNSLSDSRLQLYLLQLVQVLKYEAYDDSSLARFLLHRACSNPQVLGTRLYWYLSAEAHCPFVKRRFEKMIQLYLMHCNIYSLELQRSKYVMKQLEGIAIKVKQLGTSVEREQCLQQSLRESFFPEFFQLPIHHGYYLSNVMIENCRVLDSKKKPLWMVFQSSMNNSSNPFITIFKLGDDLRQDQLVLQILSIMDDIWKEKGLDLSILPYGCMSTGLQVGMIEVVPNAKTIAQIVYSSLPKSSRHQGIHRKIAAARDSLQNNDILREWVVSQSTRENEQDEVSPRKHAVSLKKHGVSLKKHAVFLKKHAVSLKKHAVSSPKHVISSDSERVLSSIETFKRSCAGYCVATYVLGIGDRHNDNIMLQNTGKLFHIDFGHFLGNFKKKFGVKRERAPFVLTPAMVDVMGGFSSRNFKDFVNLSCEAFNILRHNARLLLTLLYLMVGSDIPELQNEEDIQWVSDALMLHLTDDEAAKKFEEMIHASLHTKTTQVNDAIHLLAH